MSPSSIHVKNQTPLVTDKNLRYKECMRTCAYLSNLSPRWSLAKQEEMLSAALPSWSSGVVKYRDELTIRERRGHAKASLIQRSEMLRGTKVAKPENVYLASLAVLAWSVGDMLECLSLAHARGSTVHVLDEGLVLSPAAGPGALHKAIASFEASRKGDVAYSVGIMGGKISAERRSAAAKAAAETIRLEWGMPSDQHPTETLLKRSGISRNTAKVYLGLRKKAQEEYHRTINRKARKEARKV